MANTLARIKQAGKHFEIIVDLDDALKFKKGELTSIEAEGDKIFTDSKKGQVASGSDLRECFKTEDTKEIIYKYDDQKISIADSVSMAVMLRFGIYKILTFDFHF